MKLPIADNTTCPSAVLAIMARSVMQRVATFAPGN